MQGRRHGAVLLGVAVAACAWAAPAQGQAFPQRFLNIVPHAKFQGTNGYDVIVFAAGRHDLGLVAETGHTVVDYETEDASAGKGRLIGSFGEAGSAAMHFDPHGKRRTHRFPGCEGTYETKRGTWEGEISFVGYGGVTAVQATEAPGSTVVSAHLHDCTLRGEDDGTTHTRRGWFLDVRRGDAYDGRGTAFEVTWLNGRKRADVSMRWARTDGPVAITFEATTTAPRDAVHLSLRRGRARIAPGPPFVGTGRYRTSEEIDIRQGFPLDIREIWTGDLAVVFPGLAPMPLVGPRFQAGFGQLVQSTTISDRTPFAALEPPLAGPVFP